MALPAARVTRGKIVRMDQGSEQPAERASERASFWDEIRSRIIIRAPMDRDVRVTFQLGALTLLIAVIVAVMREHLGPPIFTIAGALPLGAVAVYALGQYVVFTLYFKGLLQIHRHLRNGALALTALVLFAVPSWQDFRLIDFLLIAPIAALWYYADTKDQLAPRAALKPAAVASAGLSVVFALAALTGQDAILFELSGAAGVLAAVGLFMASTDIAEIVQVGADAIADRLAFRSGILSAALVCAAALVAAIAGTIAVGADPAAFGMGFAVVMWFALVFWMLLSVGKKRKLVVTPHLPYGILLGVVVLCGLAFYAGVAARFVADPATYEPAKLFSYDQVVAAGTLLFLFFTAGLLIVGRRSIEYYLFFGYGSTVGVFWFINFTNHGQTLHTAPFGVAFGSLVFLAVAALWPKTRDRLGAVCGLLIAVNLAFGGYALLASIFLAAPTRFAEGSILQALIVLVALGWDILTSGNVTNRQSERVPRNARVSFFIGYVSLVALLVMMSSASSFVVPGTAKPIEHVFESEGFVAVGLILFGAPLLLFIFAVRMREILAAAPEPRAEKAAIVVS